ncbi:MAG: chemotaxis protein CheW [Alphaproteobacteria bacterium]|jgi:purine-binding chemotaxis protein CheW|nr:chemotaxis protein CheW [Alphaproteobacteria bacterium]
MKLPIALNGRIADGQEIDEGAAGIDERQFITFQIGDEEYGVDILAVREIRAWSDVTMLPNTPDYVLGVLNLRGVILPVFDLRCRFGMGLAQPTGRHVIIVLATSEKLIGVLVDQVAEILLLSAAEIRTVPEMSFSIDQEFLAGLAAVNERLVALIDVEHMFDADSLLATRD